MRFKVTIRGRARYFTTLDAARHWANKYYRLTGIILGIESAR